ncbi:hypothetical protein EDB92DRAFT_1955712 [Lactarius akahatsu]|uniref:Cation-transporting P-type ATPase C-terminal domain-containing protein n=1 Tax=Lactarius akahatsu TaxID=416441 RepID=A0AAD4Q2N4_9AGAM|nr:hypothetical protein EDB92DRAFT_1955712 [Lactarius akahatsu]
MSPISDNPLTAVDAMFVCALVLFGDGTEALIIGALALATDPASPVLLDRNPDKKTDPLVTVNMTKRIIGQSSFLMAIIFTFHFLGSQILGFHHTGDSTLKKHHNDIVWTLISKMFVFAGIFKSFNCRRLDQKLNILRGCGGIGISWPPPPPRLPYKS